MTKQDAGEMLTEIGFDELCHIYHITPDFIQELIAYGTIEPHGNTVTTWRFDSQQLRIIRTAIHLHHDLEVNHAGIALAIDLLEQIQDMQAELNALNKYFKT